ncbi:YgaP family membrane protein [Candidatus Mycobacterium methanotrophicum]|uniref:YgaP family membrane protein n=1 Tax=Candidatus Mycobacterium methanotrophicum TaxID=2943498 RepID=UPI001C5A4A1E
MSVNEGKAERIIRVFAGVFLLVGLPIMLPGAAKWWGLVGLLPLLTGLSGYCPVWSLLGINTCSRKRAG